MIDIIVREKGDGDLRHIGGKEGVKMEAETGVVRPQAKKCRDRQQLEGGQGTLP